MLRRFYLDGVLRYPWVFVGVFLALGIWFATYLPDFRLQAGTSALVLEGDDSKVVYDETREIFTTDDYVLVAVQPPDPWTPEGVALVEELRQELLAIDGVTSVLSPTTVPLFTSSTQPGLKASVLTDEDVDLDKARVELSEFPLYSNQFVSSDGRVFNLIAYFEQVDPEVLRAEYRELQAQVEAADAPSAELIAQRDAARERVLAAKAKQRKLHRHLVGEVRALLPKYREKGTVLYASGLPTLTVDMVNYLEHDILVFGIAVSVFLLVTLFVLFRKHTNSLALAEIMIKAQRMFEMYSQCRDQSLTHSGRPLPIQAAKQGRR